MVETKEYFNDKNILIAPELAYSIGVQVTNTGVTADAEGKKIIKAGTPIGGTTSPLENRQTVLTVSNDTNAKGVILHDTDVTKGQTNATMVVIGIVDLDKLDTAPAGDAKTALTKITFVKGL